MGHQIFANLKVRSLYFQNTTYVNESDLTISLGYRDEKSMFELVMTSIKQLLVC